MVQGGEAQQIFLFRANPIHPRAPGQGEAGSPSFLASAAHIVTRNRQNYHPTLRAARMARLEVLLLMFFGQITSFE